MPAELWRDPAVRELVDLREAIDCYLHDLAADLDGLAEAKSRLAGRPRAILRVHLTVARDRLRDAAAVVDDELLVRTG